MKSLRPSRSSVSALAICFSLIAGAFAAHAVNDFRTLNPGDVFPEDNTGTDQFIVKTSTEFEGSSGVVDSQNTTSDERIGFGDARSGANDSYTFFNSDGDRVGANTATSSAEGVASPTASSVSASLNGNGAGGTSRSTVQFGSRRVFKVTSPSLAIGTRVTIPVTLRASTEVQAFFGSSELVGADGNNCSANVSVGYYLFPSKQHSTNEGSLDRNMQWQVSYSAATTLIPSQSAITPNFRKIISEYDPSVNSRFAIDTQVIPVTGENELGQVIVSGSISHMSYDFADTVPFTVTVGEEFGITCIASGGGWARTHGANLITEPANFSSSMNAANLGAYEFDLSALDVAVLPVGSPTHTLNLESQNAEMGSVSPAGETVHPEGAVVEIEATPKPGFRFTGWSGDQLGDANPALILMHSAKTIVAEFEPVLALDNLGVRATFLENQDHTGILSMAFNLPANASLNGTGFAILDANYRLQMSPDLSVWTDVPQEQIISVVSVNEPDGKTVTWISVDMPESVRQTFIRLGKAE